jgi:hypothetical protein
MVCVAVEVLVGMDVAVAVGCGVDVRVLGTGGKSVFESVSVGRRVRVDVAVSVGVEVLGIVAVEVNVGAETISEKASTVSTMTVLMLATKKSTTPTGGVPACAAWLISLTPTAAAPHNKLTPITAARTTHNSGR